MTKSFALAIVWITAATVAQASLLTTDVEVVYNFQNVSTTDIVTVGAGSEIECLGGSAGNANICSILTAGNQSLDFDAFTITYLYAGPAVSFNNVTPNGFGFQNLNPGSPIVDVLLTSSIAGLDSSRLTFTGDSIQLNMSGLTLSSAGETFQLQLVTQPVPEPVSGLLVAVSLGFLVWKRSRVPGGRQRGVKPATPEPAATF